MTPLRGVRADRVVRPYGRSIEARTDRVSPSVTAFGRDTSLYTREALAFRACGRGERGIRIATGAGNGLPRQCEHWLGMTPLRGVAHAR